MRVEDKNSAGVAFTQRGFVTAVLVLLTWMAGHSLADDPVPAAAEAEAKPVWTLLRVTRARSASGARNLKMNFNWLGNMVVSSDPPAKGTPLFTGKPRVLPTPAGPLEQFPAGELPNGVQGQGWQLPHPRTRRPIGIRRVWERMW